MGRSMEYRGIEYTVVRDERGSWQWAVSLGNPAKVKSGHAASKGAAVLKVWAAIDRTQRKARLRSLPNVSGNEVPPQRPARPAGAGRAALAPATPNERTTPPRWRS